MAWGVHLLYSDKYFPSVFSSLPATLLAAAEAGCLLYMKKTVLDFA